MPSVAGYTAPITGTFSGQAPTPTAYGSFTAPDPRSLASDPSYQFDLGEQLKAQQRSAAAHGTLLTGGLQKRLGEIASGVASQHYGDTYNRALSAYTANRDTNAQNFGQSLASYGAGRDTFNANTAATLGVGRLGLDANTAAYGQARDAYGDQVGEAATAADVANVNAQNQHQDELDAFAQQAALQRQYALSASAPRRLPGDPGQAGGR